MPKNVEKYEKLNLSLYGPFTQLLIEFAKKSENRKEETVLISVAKEVWNISYFDKKAQEQEINNFLTLWKIENTKLEKYKNMMFKGIKSQRCPVRKLQLIVLANNYGSNPVYFRNLWICLKN